MATFSCKWLLRKRGHAALESPPIPRAAPGRRAPAGPWARVPRAGRFPSCPGRSRRPDTQGRPLLPPGRSPATRERRAGAALTAAPAGCVQLGLRCLCLSLPPRRGRPLNPHVGHGPRAAGWPPPRPREPRRAPERPRGWGGLWPANGSRRGAAGAARTGRGAAGRPEPQGLPGLPGLRRQGPRPPSCFLSPRFPEAPVRLTLVRPQGGAWGCSILGGLTKVFRLVNLAKTGIKALIFNYS